MTGRRIKKQLSVQAFFNYYFKFQIVILIMPLIQQKAYGYLRVAAKGQVKFDSFRRQEQIIRQYADLNDFKIIRMYKDNGSGATLMNRPALAEMFLDLELNGYGVKTVIVEKMRRLAEDMMIQESIIQDLKNKDLSLISATEDDNLLKDDPERMIMRQMLGTFVEYDRSMLVIKLKAARDRKRKRTGKRVEGKKTYQQVQPELVNYIRQLRRKPMGGKRMTLNQIAEKLNSESVKTLQGRNWNKQLVCNVLNPKTRRNKALY